MPHSGQCYPASNAVCLWVCSVGVCVTDAKDAFKAFDKKGEDHIKVGDIEHAMKKMGHTFKSEFLEKLEDLIDTEGKSSHTHVNATGIFQSIWATKCSYKFPTF